MGGYAWRVRAGIAAVPRSLGRALVQDNPLWIRMLEDRNLTVHTYDERTAQKIYNGLRDYLPLFEQLHQGLSRHLGAK